MRSNFAVLLFYLLIFSYSEIVTAQSPTIISPSASTYNAREGDVLHVPFNARSSVNNNTLRFTYNVTPMPEGAELNYDPITTQKRFLWWPKMNQSGTYNLTFQVTDELNRTTSKVVTIQVADRVDGTPGIKVSKRTGYDTFEMLPPPYEELVSPAHSASIRIDSADPDSSKSQVTLSVQGLPTAGGITQDYWNTSPNTNLFLAWTPGLTNIGSFAATIVARDNTGKETSVPLVIKSRNRSNADNTFHFFPHIYSGLKNAFYHDNIAIKNAVVSGNISIGVVASNDGTQLSTVGNNPDAVPPSNARFRIVLLRSDGTETNIGGVLKQAERVSLDTTTLPDGQYVISIDLLDGDLPLWHPWNLILIVDNNGSPEPGPQKVAALGTRGTYGYWYLPGGKQGVDWVTVNGASNKPTEPYPARIIAPPANSTARNALLPGSAWFFETTTKNYTYREDIERHLSLTADGHTYIAGSVGRGYKTAAVGPAHSLTLAKRYVGFDGPRNNNQVSDQSDYTPDPLSSGFIGVEPSGRVFRVARNGTVTTIFGPRRKSNVVPYHPFDPNVTDQQRESQNEPFIGQYDIKLDNPWDPTFDPLNPNILFIADLNNSRIAKIDFSGPTPILSTFAGQVGATGFVDGSASAARFNGPSGLTADPVSGVLYVADRYNHAIRKIDRNGNVTTVAGKGPNSTPDIFTLQDQVNAAGGKVAYLQSSVPISTANLYFPLTVRMDSNRNLVISETVLNAIRRINLQTQNVEKIGFYNFDSSTSASKIDVDWRGNIGPVNDIIIANDNTGGRFTRLSADGSQVDEEGFLLPVFYELGTYNAGYGAGGTHHLCHSVVIDDESSAIGLVSYRRTSLTVLRPIQGGDVPASHVDPNWDAFTNGLATAAAGTAWSLPFDRLTPALSYKFSEANSLSLRPSLYNLYGSVGHALIGNLGTYDDLGKLSDADLANFIRSGAGGSIPRPEITGVDLRDLIYFIRTFSLRGKSEQPNLTTITSNLVGANLHNTSDSKNPEIRDIVVTPLSDTLVNVNWVTDEPTIGYIEYGTTESLGLSTAIETSFSNQHQITIKSLIPDRQYHLRIRQKDISGNLAYTADVPFLLGNPDIQPPTVPGNLTVTSNSATSLSLSWNASVDAVELAGYHLDVSLNSNFTSLVPGNSNLFVGNVTSKVVRSLLPETTYYVRVRSVDVAGNQSANSNVVSTTLPQAPPNQAPVVNAGVDQRTTVIDPVSLSASATDDGLPINPGTLSYSWKRFQAPVMSFLLLQTKNKQMQRSQRRNICT